MAEATARELGRDQPRGSVGPDRPGRGERAWAAVAVRWLRRLLEEDESLTIEEAAMAGSCLSALGGPSHEEAYGMLAAMAETANWQRSARRV